MFNCCTQLVIVVFNCFVYSVTILIVMYVVVFHYPILPYLSTYLFTCCTMLYRLLGIAWKNLPGRKIFEVFTSSLPAKSVLLKLFLCPYYDTLYAVGLNWTINCTLFFCTTYYSYFWFIHIIHTMLVYMLLPLRFFMYIVHYTWKQNSVVQNR